MTPFTDLSQIWGVLSDLALLGLFAMAHDPKTKSIRSLKQIFDHL